MHPPLPALLRLAPPLPHQRPTSGCSLSAPPWHLQKKTRLQNNEPRVIMAQLYIHLYIWQAIHTHIETLHRINGVRMYIWSTLTGQETSEIANWMVMYTSVASVHKLYASAAAVSTKAAGLRLAWSEHQAITCWSQLQYAGTTISGKVTPGPGFLRGRATINWCQDENPD